MPVYRKYVDQEKAMADLVTLREKDLEADLSQVMESGILVYSLELDEADFNQADQFLKASSTEGQSDFEFTDYSNEELKEIVIKANEYAADFVKLAEAELTKRGITGLDSLVQEQENHTQELLDEIKQGSSISSFVILLMYLAAFGGGILGLATGWFVESGRTKGPDGNLYFSYDENARKHGRVVKLLGIFFMVFWVSERFFFPLI